MDGRADSSGFGGATASACTNDSHRSNNCMTTTVMTCVRLHVMNLLLHIIPAVAFLLAPAADIREKPGGKLEDTATESPVETILCYDTAERIAAMSRCEAEVEETFSCCVRMRTSDGSRIWIGSPATTSEVLNFLPTLEAGRNYTFPDAFLDWQETQQP